MDALKVAAVTGSETEPVRDRGRGDPQIVRADGLSAVGQVCPDIGVDACDVLSDRYRLQTSQDMFDECASPCAGVSASA